MAKRKLKKTKKAIQGRIYYRKKKVKELAVKLEAVSDRSKNLIKFGKGKNKKSHKTIHDILSNQILDQNKIIAKENKKLKVKSKLPGYTQSIKDFKKEKKANDIIHYVGNLWNKKELLDFFNNPKTKVVNGMRKDKFYPNIVAQMDKMFIEAYDKYAQIFFILNIKTGISRFYLTGQKPGQKINP